MVNLYYLSFMLNKVIWCVFSNEYYYIGISYISTIPELEYGRILKTDCSNLQVLCDNCR